MSGATSPRPLEAYLGYWLRFVSNHVTHSFSLKLKTRDVTVAEWVVMRELFEQDCEVPSELATRLGMTRGAISKLVDRLAAKSLVTKTSSEEDRRYQSLALTPEGRTLVPKLSALAELNDVDFFGHLPPTERALLETSLKALVRHHGLKTVPID